MMMKIFELLKNTKNLVIFSITCAVVCVVGKYRDFDFVEMGSFKLSFDFVFFFSLVGVVVSSLVLMWKILYRCYSWIKNLYILYILKNCTSQEKDFLYNRVYENDNELSIEMNYDGYFYKKKRVSQFSGSFTYELYKKQFNTKEKVIKFLRQLENKKIIQYHGNKSMIIPISVWTILVKYASEIFGAKKNGKIE